MSSLVLNSLKIEGFRAFEKLTIKQFSRVNLIVGKNNVGKTSLLEALRVYAHRGPDMIKQILTARDEMSSLEEDDTVIKYLFYGRKILVKFPVATTFAIGPLNTLKLQLIVKAQWFGEKPGGEQLSFFDKEDTFEQLNLFNWKDRIFPGIYITFDDEIITSMTLTRFFDNQLSYLLTSPLQRVEETPCLFIPANSLDNLTLTRFWDKIALKPQEEDVLKGMHLIAPDVEKINLIAGERKSARNPFVKVRHVTDPIPLRSLGEGMMRLFGLILALVNARDGLLLIDEVESGLHYSVYPDLWRLIFQLATQLNVQVFATTHSLDCIQGFQQMTQHVEGEAGMLIRLERRQEHIVPILFDAQRLSIATRQDIEVR